MSLLVDFQAKVLDYVKSMPEAGKGEDMDLEVWGKGFCSMMVRHDSFVHSSFANNCSVGRV
jgi:hypothetical protein